ncbi:uncharacterized protein EV420DRAFT_1037318 [Desarmillaria tabescens]|uniref:Uncharacterized protein n=1 Tax=Armillaria tabescens TaxID=1929756 RepID=A0AA39NEV2_ARMTA|nr:uncharacterized protein EV420DRAFT_1037318 [Desarmillaria tabescens]KAK0464334.1 hypothetical protein EV420DRAFT_1037318 [Desarmillaria tabescens]
MIDAGASTYAAVGVAYLVKWYIIVSPKKKVKSLFLEMDRAQGQYMNAASVIPPSVGVTICTEHELLAKDIACLHKSRWGHWKNRSAFTTVRERVETHCEEIFATSRKYLVAAYLASAQERLAEEQAELKASSTEEECRSTTREESGHTQTSGTIQTLPSGSSTLMETTSSTMPLNLSTTSLPLHYPVMTPSKGDTQTSGPLSELEGLILDGDLINFSDVPQHDLGQREGMLIDFSSEDSDVSTIYRLSLGENDTSQTAHLPNSGVVPPNVVTETSALSDKLGATANPCTQPSTGLSTEPHSAEDSAGCFGGAATTQAIQMVNSVASAVSAIAGAIRDS